jgi:hypothetical protein
MFPVTAIMDENDMKKSNEPTLKTEANARNALSFD